MEHAALSGQYGSRPLPLFTPPPALVAGVKAAAVLADSGLHGRIPVIDVPLVLGDAASLADYAEVHPSTPIGKVPVRIRQWPGLGGRAILGGTGGGTTEGAFTAKWDPEDRCSVQTESVGHTYSIGWRNGGHIYVQDANYHPDGSQVFESLDGEPFILLLSKHQDDVTITPSHFTAFYCSGKETLNLYPGVWHQAVFPIGDQNHLYTKQGKVHGVVYTDFLHEFGVRVRIREAFKPPGAAVPSEAPIQLPAQRRAACGPHRGEASAAQEARMAGDEAFRPFGRILGVPPADPHIPLPPWPAKERPMVFGDEAGLTSNGFSLEWEDISGTARRDLLVIHQGRWQDAGVSHRNNNRLGAEEFDEFIVTKLFCRVDGPHVVFPRESEAFAILVAEPCPACEEPNLATIKAFVVDQPKGMMLSKGTWSTMPIPVHRLKQLPFVEKFSAVGARKEFSFVDENLPLPKIRVKRLSGIESSDSNSSIPPADSRSKRRSTSDAV